MIDDESWQYGYENAVSKFSDDLQELHLHREVKRMADELDYWVSHHKGKYHIYPQFPKDVIHGPYTLPQLHEKLTELTEAIG